MLDLQAKSAIVSNKLQVRHQATNLQSEDFDYGFLWLLTNSWMDEYVRTARLRCYCVDSLFQVW